MPKCIEPPLRLAVDDWAIHYALTALAAFVLGDWTPVAVAVYLAARAWIERRRQVSQGQAMPELVSLKDAAQSLGVTRQALAQRIQRRGISPVRRLVRERALVYLSEAMLEELRASPEEAGGRQGEQARQGGDLAEDLARLRREIEELRVANAKLEGELAAALKVEAATSRLADKLEARLEDERRGRAEEALRQERELGRLEASTLLLRERVVELKGPWYRRLLGR